MKKLIVSALFIGLCSVQYGFSQNAEEKIEKRNEHHVETMKKELDLTEDQAKKLEAIHDKYKAKEEAQREQMKALREEMKKLREAKHEEVKAILTPEQAKKMEEKMEERKEERKEMKKEVREVKKEQNQKK
ncbi:MAG: Spy/CpxP family protein refolding chaperone [Brumimicrobium sp.]|nr:Spy/CpxP family protein refolding chaperone [Brumimicrobium sp.]